MTLLNHTFSLGRRYDAQGNLLPRSSRVPMGEGSPVEPGSSPIPASMTRIFQDTFETGDFTHTENGFAWGSINRTSIVRDDGCAVHIEPPNCVEGNPGEWENGPGVAGRHSMRFRYPANEYWSEQRFNIGGSYSELWMSFWIRVPINFTHERPGNNKFFAVWFDSYNLPLNPIAVASFWEISGTSSSRFSIAASIPSEGGDTAPIFAPGVFISVPEDRGRWMHFVAQLKGSESGTTNTGIFRTWRRWEDDSEYTFLVEKTDYGFEQVEGGNPGWSGGYLMGYANSTYPTDTEFLMDDFELYAEIA